MMQSATYAHQMLFTEVLDRAFADERVRRLLHSDWLHGFPENDVAPGNRRCTVCSQGPRWCCACPCSGCGFASNHCKCEVGQYELHPFMTSWESLWHTVGHPRDFKRGICVFTETVRELFDEASWESRWHTVGHSQDFKRGVCVLTETVQKLFDAPSSAH